MLGNANVSQIPAPQPPHLHQFGQPPGSYMATPQPPYASQFEHPQGPQYGAIPSAHVSPNTHANAPPMHATYHGVGPNFPSHMQSQAVYSGPPQDARLSGDQHRHFAAGQMSSHAATESASGRERHEPRTRGGHSSNVSHDRDRGDYAPQGIAGEHAQGYMQRSSYGHQLPEIHVQRHSLELQPNQNQPVISPAMFSMSQHAGVAPQRGTQLPPPSRSGQAASGGSSLSPDTRLYVTDADTLRPQTEPSRRPPWIGESYAPPSAYSHSRLPVVCSVQCSLTSCSSRTWTFWVPLSHWECVAILLPRQSVHTGIQITIQQRSTRRRQPDATGVPHKP